MIKKWFTSSNLITILILLIVFYFQIPTIINNDEHQGKNVSPRSYLSIEDGKELVFPPSNSAAIVIFWATWCAPCKLEMNRYKSSIENEQIPVGKVFAINPFEDKLVVKKFLKAEKYPFVFIDAPELARSLKVDKTPTVLFIENGMITTMTTGISFIGIWKAESLF